MGAWFFLAAAITLAAPQGSGQTTQPLPPAPPVSVAPIPPDGDIERFLKEADVVSTKGTKKGVTDSLRATLSDGKLTHDAHIQNIDETKREFRSQPGRRIRFPRQLDVQRRRLQDRPPDRAEHGAAQHQPHPSLDAVGVYLVDRRRPHTLAGSQDRTIRDRGSPDQLRARALTAEGREFVVSLARRDVIVAFTSGSPPTGAPTRASSISPTFNVVDAVLAADNARPVHRRDWLLVNVAPDYVTLAILRGPHVIFFRNRAAETDGTLADLVHQTAMYYEDRLSGAGFARVLLAGAGGGGARHAGRSRTGASQPAGPSRGHRRYASICARRWPLTDTYLGGAGVSRHAGAARGRPPARAGA